MGQWRTTARVVPSSPQRERVCVNPDVRFDLSILSEESVRDVPLLLHVEVLYIDPLSRPGPPGLWPTDQGFTAKVVCRSDDTPMTPYRACYGV